MNNILIDNDTRLSDPELELEKGKKAHIVRADGDKTGVALVTEARVFGTTVEALCGFLFVPHENPKELPWCEECKEIYDLERAMNEHLHETPKDA